MKYSVVCWAHVNYLVTVEADSAEEAYKIANDGGGHTDADFRHLDVGDSGVIKVTDEDGKETWYD